MNAAPVLVVLLGRALLLLGLATEDAGEVSRDLVQGLRLRDTGRGRPLLNDRVWPPELGARSLMLDRSSWLDDCRLSALKLSSRFVPGCLDTVKDDRLGVPVAEGMLPGAASELSDGYLYLGAQPCFRATHIAVTEMRLFISSLIGCVVLWFDGGSEFARVEFSSSKREWLSEVVGEGVRGRAPGGVVSDRPIDLEGG